MFALLLSEDEHFFSYRIQFKKEKNNNKKHRMKQKKKTKKSIIILVGEHRKKKKDPFEGERESKGERKILRESCGAFLYEEGIRSTGLSCLPRHFFLH